MRTSSSTRSPVTSTPWTPRTRLGRHTDRASLATKLTVTQISRVAREYTWDVDHHSPDSDSETDTDDTDESDDQSTDPTEVLNTQVSAVVDDVAW